jgi:hypothetical protein
MPLKTTSDRPHPDIHFSQVHECCIYRVCFRIFLLRQDTSASLASAETASVACCELKRHQMNAACVNKSYVAAPRRRSIDASVFLLSIVTTHC